MKLNKPWLLFGLSLLLFSFWSQAFPVTDPVEANYALTAKEMAKTADWISPRLYGKVWYDKPVLIYWLLALAMKAFGYAELGIRLVPAIAGAGGVALIYWFVVKVRSERAGLLAATLLATALQYFIIAKLLITDSLLFTFNAAALVFFYLGYINQGAAKRWYLLSYPCLGLAVLTKGPVGVLLPGLIVLTFFTWRKNWSELRQMRLGVGLLLFLLVALPWYWLMYVRHGQAFLRNFFGIHNYLRATVSEHPRDNVLYYYPLLFVASTLPWTGVCFAGLGAGWRQCRQQHDLATFLMVWTGVFVIFYSLMATKYPTYTFPMLFPVIVLTACYLEESLEQNKSGLGWLAGSGLLLWCIIMILIGGRYLHGVTLVTFVTVNVLCLLGATLWSWRLTGFNRAGPLVAGIIAGYLLLAMLVVPALGNDRSGKQLARILAPYTDYQIGVYRFYSTAAVYYSGNRLIMLEARDHIHNFRQHAFSWFAKYTMPVATVPEFLAGPGRPKMIIIKRSGWPQFRSEAGGVALEKVAQNAEYLLYHVRASQRRGE
jgi:4-amino-4-deoxy-L-arabinose transferase-like glycosyltransferase